MSSNSSIIISMQPEKMLETTLPIHEADKIFSKLREEQEEEEAEEPSSAVSSKAMYYGRVQSSIPFGWESHPGKPKTAPEPNPNDVILTLTPPPSLYSSPSSSSMSSSSSSGSPKNGKGSSCLSPNCIASKLKGNPKRAQTGSSSSSSDSSLSSLSPSSSWSGPVLSASAPASRVQRERHRRNSIRSELGFRDRYYENVDRPKSTDSEFSSATAKFVGARKRAPLNNKLKGCFVATTLKRAVLAVVGRRSGNRDT